MKESELKNPRFVHKIREAFEISDLRHRDLDQLLDEIVEDIYWTAVEEQKRD